jgi:putative ABC transport system substrate-binding protein
MTSLHRRTLIIGLCSAAVVPMGARAQTTERVYRVGYLTPGPGPGGSRPLLDLLIAALRERGWMVGRNLIIEIRDTRGDPVRAEALAKELVQARADLIVTSATGTAMAAHRATTVVPIVMITSGVPVEGGLAKSLARPGGNVTGMTIYAGGFGLWGKYLELLRELVPSLRELGVLWGYAPPSYRMEQVAPATDELRRAANALNVNVRFWQTGRESDLRSGARGRRARAT